ncbi:integrase core domain-containing protein [Chryseobacterium indoltheticum]|uniref:integrase core domain-containing protein n=1 Tax=Chryseobacterium indoltheticum TaxID=254 RepID=UPI0040434BD7
MIINNEETSLFARFFIIVQGLQIREISVLDARIFNSLIEVREITSDWMVHYNNRRQHESLGNLSPMQYLLKEENSPNPGPNIEFSP